MAGAVSMSALRAVRPSAKKLRARHRMVRPINLTSSFTFAANLVPSSSRLEIGLTWTSVPSLHQLDLTWPPLLREKWLKRAVETQGRDKTFAWHGLDPVSAFHALGLGR